MKKYEKPAITLIAMSANTAICNCGVNIDIIGPDIPGGFTADGGDCSIPVDGYCKFTGANVVFAS